MKFLEEEYELWDSELQNAIKIIVDCQNILVDKSKTYYEYEITTLKNCAESIFNICYKIRKEDVKWEI